MPCATKKPTRNVCKGSDPSCFKSKSLIVLSALPVANDVSFRHARSKIGASWIRAHFFNGCRAHRGFERE